MASEDKEIREWGVGSRLWGTAASETLAVKTEWLKTEGQIPLEAGDETWQVKIKKSGNGE